MKKAIIINGQGGVGKDTIIGITELLVKEPVYSITSIAVVNEAARMLGWEGDKNDRDRKFLSDLKKLSTWYNDQPTEYMTSSLAKTEDDAICFFHIREPEEIQRFIEEVVEQKIHCEIYTMLVQRFEREYGNESDDNVENYKYDFTIDNSGDIVDTELQVIDFLSRIGVSTNENRGYKTSNSGGGE